MKLSRNSDKGKSNLSLVVQFVNNSVFKKKLSLDPFLSHLIELLCLGLPTECHQYVFYSFSKSRWIESGAWVVADFKLSNAWSTLFSYALLNIFQ